MHRPGIIVLAAGNSRRMGQPKQLLPFEGTTLIRRACQLALGLHPCPVVVVLGAMQKECQRQISDLPVMTVVNEEWHLGMGRSLAVGLRALLQPFPEIPGVLVMLHDQPLIPVASLRKLIDQWESAHHPISASRYGGTLGVPAIFSASLFSRLENLPPQEGARHLIQADASLVSAIDLPEAELDLDTPADYERLLSNPFPHPPASLVACGARHSLPDCPSLHQAPPFPLPSPIAHNHPTAALS